MSQELGITEKSADFMNPYRTERDDVSTMQSRCLPLCLSLCITITEHTDVPTLSHAFQVLHTAEAFQKILREEEKRRRKEEKRKEIRKGPRISRSRTEL